MSRPALRLVEPLESSLDFPQGKSEATGLREITSSDEIYSHLQLFFSWPDYSSALIKVDGEMVKATFTIDESISEIDQLYISIDLNSYNKIREHKNRFEKSYIEVFGITFGFVPVICECIDEFVEGLPCLSIGIPTALTRYNTRSSKRVRVEDPQTIIIDSGARKLIGKLVDVSPQAFCIKTETDIQPFDNRVTVSVGVFKFDVLATKAMNNNLILKPISDEPENFGPYFDLYVSHAYPMLKSRYAFPEDPIPSLMNSTGQAKKHATSEKSSTWMDKINEAYLAAKDVLNSHVAQYVAIDSTNKPIGTSALASAFISSDEKPIWIFHGLGASQNPDQLDLTCALYNWRVDYLLAKNDKANICMWFDGRGKWLEKVYIKYSKLTSNETKIWPIKHNRYERISSEKTTLFPIKPSIVRKSVKVGLFERELFASEEIIAGFGVPYLNYSGILNNISFVNPNSKKVENSDVTMVVAQAQPEVFFIETPTDYEDYQFDDYQMRFVDATNRQCNTNGAALKFFTSSLEHSKALVKRKYGL